MKHVTSLDWDGEVMRVECSCGLLREYTRRADGSFECTRFLPSPEPDFDHDAGAGGIEMGSATDDSGARGVEFFIGPDDPRLGPWEDFLRGIQP